MEFDLENPLTSSNDEEHRHVISLLFSSEPEFKPSSVSSSPSHSSSSYYASFRQAAISIVSSSSQPDPFVPYLAVNYIDRFVSRLQSLENKPWVVHLLAVSCLSLAAKMRNSDFSISNFQEGGVGFGFDEKTVSKMEMVILDALHWRMRSVTPFSFVHFFSSLLETEEPGRVRDRAREIIFKAQHEIKLVEVRPSVVAASAVLVACQELFPLQFLSFHCSVSSSGFVDMGDLERCLKIVGEMDVTDTTSVSGRRTPLSVLSWHSSDNETNSIGGGTSVISVAAPVKRRKIDGYRLC